MSNIFNMLLNASVTGAIVILLWCLFYPLSKKYFKASWHYTVVKIAMVFMIFPVSMFSPMLNNTFGGLFDQPPDLPRISEQIQVISIDTETINSVNSALSGIVFNNVQNFPPFPETGDGMETPDDAASFDDSKNIDDINITANITHPRIPYLQLIWLIVAIILFSDGFRKMYRFKKQILNSSDSNVDDDTQELFTQCIKQLRVRGRITLRTSEYIKTPLVLGLIKPLVVFPETDMNADEKRLALIHELTHIKNGDLWMKFFAFVISVIHWFNPFVYLLRSKLSVISEEYCDECVIGKIEKEERLLYCNLILKVVSDISAPQSKFCSPLSAPAKNMKRRLSNMVNSKKSRKSMIALSVIVAIILCSLATVYAFAANPTNIAEDTADDTTDIITPTEKDTNENIRYSGTIGLGYASDNGEITTRISTDGGFTWYDQDEKGNLIPDPDISEIKWMTYDEFRTWIDEQDQTDEKSTIYESMLEDLKNGSAEVGIIAIKGDEHAYSFTQSEPMYAVAISNGEVTIYEGEEWKEYYSQEEIEEQIAVSDSMVSYSDISEFNTDDGIKVAVISHMQIEEPKISSIYYYFAYDEADMRFGADKYKDLCKIVKDYFDEQVESGNLTQEEADSILSGISEDSTLRSGDIE